jgi:hypothetical protein
VALKAENRMAHYLAWTGLLATLCVFGHLILTGPDEVETIIPQVVVMLACFSLIVSIPTLFAKLKKKQRRIKIGT